MIRNLLIVLIIFSIIINTHGQTETDLIPITVSNAPLLTLMGQLQLNPLNADTNTDIAYDNLSADIEWSDDGEWLGIGYGYLLYVYNINRLQTNPLIFDVSFELDLAGCGDEASVMAVRDIAFSPTGWVAVSNAFEVRVYDLATGEIRYSDPVYAYDLAFLPDSRLVYSVEGETRVWNSLYDVAASRDNFEHDGTLQSGHDGLFYSANSNTGTVYQHSSDNTLSVNKRYETLACEQTGGGGGGCYTPPDIDVLAVSETGIASYDGRWCEPRTVYVMDIITGDTTGTFPYFSDFIALSNDSQLLVLNSDDDLNAVAMHNVNSGTLISVLPGTEGTGAVEFNPEGTILATYSVETGIVRLWTLPENLPSAASLRSLSTRIIDADCDSTQTIAIGETVSIGWSWYARTQEQLYDHVAAADYLYSLDGILPQRWLLLSRPEQYAPNGEDTWTIFYYLPVGTETPGEHRFIQSVTWRETITDGFGRFGTTGDVEQLTVSCEYVVQ